MNIPELLAPVGSKEALVAAVQNGADAVYLGGKLFSARQYAANFDSDELREAINYAHIRGVKVYITVNTLLADTELAEAVEYLRFLYEIGADAILIQDLGLARLSRMLLPELPLHASTQMTVHNTAGVEELKEHGFSRVVLSRELSIAEISKIRRKTGVELETFVHGALCVSYSGQCLMSSMIGGRSGNRGRCAQPCRMEYTLVNDSGQVLADPAVTGSHLLSPMDLNMIRHIPELAEAGIVSLKIEGRMKRPEYVATVVRIYRKALDRYRKDPENYSVDDRDMKDLAQIFNRGFTTGYMLGRPGRDMMSYKRPNNRGLRLGRVASADWGKKTVKIVLEETLRVGDGIEFWVTEGGRRGIVVNRILADNRAVEEAGPGQTVSIPAEGKIRPGDRVFKTNDAELMLNAEQSYKSPKEIKKIPLRFTAAAGVGSPLVITVADDDNRQFTARGDLPGQEAVNKPLTEENLARQLDRLGNTPYSIGSLEMRITGNVMVPVSEINEVRRRAIEGINDLRAEVDRKPARFNRQDAVQLLGSGHTGDPVNTSPAEIKLSVTAHRFDVLTAAIGNGADVVYFRSPNLLQDTSRMVAEMENAIGECRKRGVDLVVSTPRIVRDYEMEHVLPLIEFAGAQGLPLQAAGIGIMKEAAARGIPVYADFPLNIYNEQVIEWLGEACNLAQVTVSPELTMEQIKGIGRKTGIALEAVVEGHLPLMVTEYCPQGCVLGGLAADAKCNRPCRKKGVRGLKDRLGLVFPLATDEFCRNYIYNAKELCMIEDIIPLHRAGISVFRIETSIEDPARIASVVKAWRKELAGFAKNPEHYEPEPGVKEKIDAMSPAGLTKGHYYRGVE